MKRIHSNFSLSGNLKDYNTSGSDCCSNHKIFLRIFEKPNVLYDIGVIWGTLFEVTI